MVDSEKKPVARAAIEQDAYDRLVYGQAVQDLSELKGLHRRSRQAENVLRDVHASLYKLRPQVAENSEAPHREVIEQLMGTTEYQKLRASTRMSEIGSAFGTLALGRTLTEHLPEEPEPEDDDGEGDGEQGDGDGQPGEGTPGGYLRGCGDGDEQRRLLRKLVADAQQQTEEGIEAVQALTGEGWGTGAGNGERVSLEEAVKLSSRLQHDDKLKRIARLAGRMRRLASGKRETRFRHGPDDVVDVEMGRDPARMLPTELLALVTPELQLDAYRRFAAGRMLQVKREGKERSQAGPVVVLVDESGSMGAMNGARDVWAKALALGVLSVARKERREFACGTFNWNCELRSWGKQPDWNEVLAFLGRQPSGGTDFETPLRKAMDLIEGAKERDAVDWGKADIVFITDGSCGMSDEFIADWQERAKATGVHLYTIYIGRRADSLNAISDGVAVVTDLSDDGEAIDLAFGI